MTSILPINLPRQQLPQPTDRLSDEFLHALPAPVGLWTPSKLALAAADFTPLPQKHFGTLNGGVTTAPGGFGVLGQGWKFDGSNGKITIASGPTVDTGKPFTIFSAFYLNDLTTDIYPKICTIQSVQGLSPFEVTCSSQANYNGIVFGSSSTWGQFTTNTITPPVGLWQAAAVTYNGAGATTLANFQVYWNQGGRNFSSQALTTSASFASLGNSNCLGGPSSGGSSNFLFGRLAIVIVFQSLLTSPQVSALYSCLLYGEPFPLFAPQVSDLAFGAGAASTGGLLLRRRRMAA